MKRADQTSGQGDASAGEVPDFALVGGGPFDRLLQRAGLAGDTPAALRRRIVVLALVAWLPLLLLCAWDGRLLDRNVTVPFLLDIEAHVRFLVALPLLLVAEVAAHRRLPVMLRQFHERQMLVQSDMLQFNTAVASASRLSRHPLAELLIVTFVYGVGVLLIYRHFLAIETTTWYANTFADGAKPTLAGLWYGLVSLPIVQFLLLRWYWRLLVWGRLLWQVARIRLSLMPAHPDRCAGLAFLAGASYALTFFAAAHGALAAGQIASRIFFTGAALTEFIQQIFALVVLMLSVILGPLLVFSPQMVATKHTALREYAQLAARYVRDFDTKWLRGGAPASEAFIGSPDVQSLADLSSAYEVVQGMRFAPLSTQALTRVATATLLPIAPLLLTMIPLNELLTKLLGMLF